VNPLEVGVRGTPEEVREATLDVFGKSEGEGIISFGGRRHESGMPKQNRSDAAGVEELTAAA